MKVLKYKLFIFISLLFALILIKPASVKAQANSIDDGISWLLNSQNADGSWSSGPKMFLDTYTVLETLLSLDIYDSQVSLGVDWVNELEVENIDDLAHQVLILSLAGEDVESKLNLLLNSQNIDGGWGFCKECKSSLLDTIFALFALKAANYHDEDVIGRLLSFISSNQNLDGGLSLGDNDNSTYLTSLFILSLKEYLSEYQFLQTNIDLASSYLLTQKNPDGSFGIEENKIFETALACRALIGAGEFSEGLAVRDYLLNTQNQNGSWEDDAYSTALVLWALKEVESIDKANLRVLGSGITILPPYPIEGQTVVVGYTVMNTGTLVAEDVKVSFYLGDPLAGGEWIGDGENITSLDPSESAYVKITWVLDGVIGDQDIYVFADPDDEIDEASEEDNIASLSFASSTKPDLTVSPADISFDNTGPLEGESFTMTAIIHNRRETDAEPVVVALYQGDPQSGGIKLTELTFTTIYGGGYGKATFDLALYAGTYYLYVEVDPENDVDESNETNNIALKSITVRPIEFQGVDLAVSASGISFSPLYPKEGNMITVAATIHNSGDRDTQDVVVRIYDGTPASGIQLAEHTYSVIISGHEKTLTVTAIFLEGNHEIFVVVDPDDTIPEISEINNEAHKTLTVMPPGEVIDLAVTIDDINFDPQTPEVGEEVAIRCGVRNVGTVRLENVKVKIYEGNPDAGGGLLYPEFTLSFIDAGGTGQITIYHNTNDWGGDHLIYVVVDPDDAILEGDEGNNRTSKLLTVSAPANPDLAISAEGITINPDVPVTGDTVAINCIVENNGSVAVSLADVSFYINGQLLGNDTVTDLQAGGSATTAFTWDTTGLAGPYTVSVIVDPLNAVSEINEFNNGAEKEITIGAPDLKVTYEDITFYPESPLGGEIVQINCEVHNIGSQPAANISVTYYEGSPDEGRLPINGSVIAEIVAGGQETVTTTWQAPISEGSYRIYVKVDPDNSILEEDKSNNLARKTVFITTQTDLSLSPSDLSIHPSKPTLDDMITINALVWNRGGIDAIGVEVAFFDGDPDSGGVMIGDVHTISRLYRGTSETIEKSLFLSEGEHEIYVVIDPENTIAESNENNNLSMISLEVKPLDGFYDDCGNPDQEPHLVQGTDTQITSADPNNPLTSLTASTHPSSVQYTYTGINPNSQYQLIVNYLEENGGERVQSLSVDGITIHEALALPDDRAEYFTFPLPSETYDDGEVTISFDLVSGPDVLVSEIYIMRKVGRKEETVSCGIEWLKSHQYTLSDNPGDVGGWTRFLTRSNTYFIRVLIATGNTGHPSFDLVKNRMYELQATNGSWGNHIYTTAEAIMALIAAGENPQSEVIRNAVEWIKSLQEDNGSWFDNPEPTGIAIAALVDAGEDSNLSYMQSAKGYLLDLDTPYWFYIPDDFPLWRFYYPVLGLVKICNPDSAAEQAAIKSAVNYYNSFVSQDSGTSLFSYINMLHLTGQTPSNSLKNQLKNCQLDDGGYRNYVLNNYSDINATSESVLALSAVGERGSCIDEAILWLEARIQGEDLLDPYERAFETALSSAALFYTGYDKSKAAIDKALTAIIETQSIGGVEGVWHEFIRMPDVHGCHVWNTCYLIWALGVIDVNFSGKDNAIEKATNYIISSQHDSGGWTHNVCYGNIPKVFYTGYSLFALLAAGVDPGGSAVADGVGWLLDPENRDENALWETLEDNCRIAMILESVGGHQDEVDNVINWLKQNQNPDGGWGEIDSNVVDTSWAIIAMNTTGNEGIETAKGVQWLLSLQNSDCGWALVPGIPASNTENTALAVWALAVSEYQMDIELELIFNKPYYYPGDLVKMAINPLNAEATSLTLSGTVTEYEGDVLPITITQNGDAFAAEHPLRDDHLPGTDIVNIVASGDSGQGSVIGSFVVKNGVGVLPDVSIVSDDISFSSNDPQEGELVTITATITNPEIRDAVNVTVRCYDGYPRVGGILIGEESVERISGLSSSSVGFSWQATSGMHEVYLVVDPEGTLPETNEQNNQAYKAIDVSEVSFEPDLSVTASEMTITPSSPLEGEMITISAVVHNRGGSGVTGALVRFFDGDPDEPSNQIGEDQIISTLPPGGSEVMESIWDTLGELGRNYIHVVTDPEHNIEEANENNNEAIKIVDIGVPDLPDLTISASDISFDPAAPLAGDTVIISVTIHNRGEPVDGIKVSFYDGGPESGGALIEEELIYSTILFGESETLEMCWETVGAAREHDIYVVIDPEDMIDEENEGNNRASAGISVDSSQLAIEISLDKGQYEADEDVLISMVITNLNSEQRVVTLDLLVIDTAGNTISELIVSEAIPLDPTEAATRDMIWNTGSRKAGEYFVVGIVRENGTPRATDRADFIIIADLSLFAQVTTDKIAYFSYEQEKITSIIRSFSPNYTFSDLEAEITVKNASDEILHNVDKSIDTLLPLNSDQWAIYWNTQTYPPGEYTVELEVIDEGMIEVSDLTSFSILPSYEGEMALNGTLTVDPAEVDRGKDVNLNYEVENIGNVDLPAVNLLLQVVQVETQDFLTNFNDQCSLNLGESCSGFKTLSTAGMPAGDCMIVLLGEVEDISQTIAFATLTIINQCPVADGRKDKRVLIGETVELDGSGSFDPDGVEINYSWELIGKPEGSSAELSNHDEYNPSITPDRHGDYLIQLIVDDGECESKPDLVLVTTENRPPVADAGDDQVVNVGDTVSLDGGGSMDPDGDLIEGYQWIIVSRPEGSSAELSDSQIVNPMFIADMAGEYIIQLIVSDWEFESEPDQVIITSNQCPTASAGEDQSVLVGEEVELDGSGSYDPDGDAITYAWSFISTPEGSEAELSDPTVVNPTFSPDLEGDYSIQLIVSDGLCESEADTVLITGNQWIPLPPDLLEEAISLEEEAVSLIYDNGDLQEARVKIQTSITKLKEIIGLLDTKGSINIRCEKDFQRALWYLNIAIYFDNAALRLIRRDRPWRRSAAIVSLMIAKWFKRSALKIIE